MKQPKFCLVLSLILLICVVYPTFASSHNGEAEMSFYDAGNQLANDLLAPSTEKAKNAIESSFAGAYFDNENKNFVIVVAGEAAKAHLNSNDSVESIVSDLLQTTIPSELYGKIVVKEGKYTYAELLATLYQMDNTIVSLDGAQTMVDLDIASYGIDEENNFITVRIYNIDENKIDAFKTSILNSPMINFINVPSHRIRETYVEEATIEEAILNENFIH